MEIERKNFRFNRIVSPYDVICDSVLFSMTQEDIDSDSIVSGERLEYGDDMLVFQNVVAPYQNERYCYLKINTLIGGDEHTKQITINKIIVDGGLINHILFARIFTILLQQEDYEHPNRIVVDYINKRFGGIINETSNEIACFIYELYQNFTSDFVTIYTTQK
jgi:hypothetical protein